MARPRATIDHARLAEAFAPDGLHGVSAAELASRAGVAKPTLYARMRSKEEVFLACVESEVERLLARLHGAEAASAGLSLEHRMIALARSLAAYAQDTPAGFRLLHVTARHRRSGVASAVDRALERVPARIAAALRHDVPGEPDAQMAARALHGALTAILAAAPPDAAPQAERVARALAGAFATPEPERHPADGLHGIY